MKNMNLVTCMSCYDQYSLLMHVDQLRLTLTFCFELVYYIVTAHQWGLSSSRDLAG